MPHLELGSDHRALSKAALIHNAKDPDETESEDELYLLGQHVESASKSKREPRPVEPEVTYEPEDLSNQPEYEKYLEANNNAILAKIDSLGGLEGYIKALEQLYNTARESEKATVPASYRDSFERMTNESRMLEAKGLLVPMYNDITYKKTRAAWYRRLLGYIEALKDSEIGEDSEEPPPPKIKKITIKGVRHNYKEGQIGGPVLIIYDISDEKLKHPLGYYKWDMDKKKPSSSLLPMP